MSGGVGSPVWDLERLEFKVQVPAYHRNARLGTEMMTSHSGVENH